jgi:hypothetical protein
MTNLVARVTDHLREAGDGKWLRTRVAVVTFEECWPLAADLVARPDNAAIADSFARVAEAAKVKDAAGLGTLGYALAKGDESVLENAVRDRAIRIVSEAIKRPKDYWQWIVKQSKESKQATLVNSAHNAFRKGGWPWDRAFMQAAAYLAVTTTIPDPRRAKTESGSFPYWVALDKHTPAGKQAIRQAAKELGVASQQALWLSFYFESVLANEVEPSYWWSREVQWRLGRIGLTYDEGKALWNKLRPLVVELLQDKAGDLERHLHHPTSSTAEQT